MLPGRGPLALRGLLAGRRLVLGHVGAADGLLCRLALAVGRGALLLSRLELALGAGRVAVGLRAARAGLDARLGDAFPPAGTRPGERERHQDEDDDDDEDDQPGIHGQGLPLLGYCDPMSPLDIDKALAWRGRTVLDRDGEKIGTLGEILLDSETDTPAWGGVRTGLFGRKESYVPLDALEEIEGEDLQAPFEKQQVIDAPGVDPDVAMSAEDETTLFRHYGREDERGGEGPLEGGEHARQDDQPLREGEMIRSEEEIRTGTTEMRPTERVRLKKVLVTDEVERTVPVRREEIRLETDPPPEGTVESVEDAPPGERPA